MPKYIVRHGVTRLLGVFSTSRGEAFQRSVRVIVRTQRGLETGEVLCEASDSAVQSLTDPSQGQILRRMSSQDELESRKMHDQEREEFQSCEGHIKRLGLEMRLVDVEHLFGGERIVVYYLAENRVDFRELVRTLASEFQTRIEMRQIGVRDEAKLLADYGDCGKEVCCNTHLSAMPPVSMKMAKVQRATLDPSKISGRCGRLKCCLRYEYHTYQTLQRELPSIGSDVVTNTGRARVLGQEILAGQLLVQTEDNRRILIEAEDVLSVISKPRDSKPKEKDRTKSKETRSDKEKASQRSQSRAANEKKQSPPEQAESSTKQQETSEPSAESTTETPPTTPPPDEPPKPKDNV